MVLNSPFWKTREMSSVGPDLDPSTACGAGRSVGRALFGEAEETVPKRLSLPTEGYTGEALERRTPGSTSALSLHHLFRVKRDRGRSSQELGPLELGQTGLWPHLDLFTAPLPMYHSHIQPPLCWCISNSITWNPEFKSLLKGQCRRSTYYSPSLLLSLNNRTQHIQSSERCRWESN